MDSTRSAYVWLLFVMSLVFFTLDIIYFNYDFFYQMGLKNEFIRSRFSRLSGTLLFKHTTIVRLFVLAVVTFAIYISKVTMKLTDQERRKTYLIPKAAGLGVIYIFSFIILYFLKLANANIVTLIYIVISFLCFLNYIYFASEIHKLFHSNMMKDRFTKESRRFEQFDKYLENEYSVNIKSEDGWVNIVNPFRASQVIGTPGSGKSYSFLIEALIQMIEKGFTMLIYDYKFPDLSLITYNALQENLDAYPVKPKYAVINFDDLERSNRCNPIQPDLLYDPSDAIASSQALMYGLYPKWAQKQGEFFTESSINFVGGCIWALKIINQGRFCTVPHLVQLIALPYDDLFTILSNIDDEFIKNILAPFLSAHEKGATDQLEGQIGTTRIALARLTSKYTYWVMTDDFENVEENGITKRVSKSGSSISLQINDPKNPMILCLANNPDKQSVYAPLLSLYNTRLMRLINKKKMQKTGVLIDELPTLSFPPGTIDNLIATARSNKIAVFLGYQDFAQLNRDLGKEIAEAIINTVGNTFSGMVNFDTAKKLSEKFGKIKIEKESVSLSKESTSVSLSTEMQELIPPSEISSLPQGVFVGQVADDRGYEIEQKVFYSKIIIDHEKRKRLEDGEIPVITTFNKSIEDTINDHFNLIKQDIKDLVDTYQGLFGSNDDEE